MFQAQLEKKNLQAKTQQEQSATATPTPEAKNGEEPRNKMVGSILESWMGETELTGVPDTAREEQPPNQTTT